MVCSAARTRMPARSMARVPPRVTRPAAPSKVLNRVFVAEGEKPVGESGPLAFPETHRSVVLAARSSDPEERARALDTLVRAY